MGDASNRFKDLYLSGSIRGPSTFYIDPSPDDTGSPGGSVTDTGTVVILGDLQVTGQTTTVDSTVVNIADLNITLANGASSAAEANGAGITIDGANATFTYDSTRDSFEVNKPFNGLNIDTNTNTDPLQISRLGTSVEVLEIGVNDTQAVFNYIEDTSSEGAGNYGSYIFQVSGNSSPTGPVNVLVLDEGQLDINGSASYQIGNSNVLNSSGTYIRLYDPEGAVRLYLGDSADARNYYDNNSHRFRLADNNTNLGERNSTGLGVGTTSPAIALHVNSGATNEAARFESTDTEVTLELKDTTGTAKIKSRADFRFETGATPSEAMRIDSSGNVGIGSTNPGAPLEVAGTATTSVDIAHFSNSNDVKKVVIGVDGEGDGQNYSN